MNKRMAFVGLTVVLVLAVAAGIALAARAGHHDGIVNGSLVPVVAAGGSPAAVGMVQACEAMHDSPAMQKLHGQMPAEVQAQCDAMHEQMDQMMSQTGSMMGGSGSWSGMMGGSMAGHHSDTPSGK